MSDSTDADALPEALEERIYEIHFETEPAARDHALDELCEAHPEHAEALRECAKTLTRSEVLLGRVRSELDLPSQAARIGPFVVRSVLGQGGFGNVYLADQIEPVQRTVALKVLQPGRVDARALRRFEGERQVLARLQHACIARIFDAGETAEGLPYFAMELVEGQPVTAWCDGQQMGVAARLHLFLRVCAAIEHAHQRGVVHRDIKPSNVLVHEEDGQPVPKVIDFGIAKLLTPDPGSEPMLTREGAQVGTPGYMSPEQAAGEPIDTRTDVYALGVLLCELLTGHLPFDRRRLSGASMAALAKMIGEEDPRRPSELLQQDVAAAAFAAERRETTAGSLQRQLRADLDWVVLKAVARQPDQRYASVSALADDVERYVRREPVSVRERVTSYWLRKFVTRHRLGVGIAASVVVAVLAGIIGLLWALGAVDSARKEAIEGGREAARQRDAATASAYSAGMAAAQLAMGSGDVHTALRYLEASEPGLRGWEWRHLAAQSDQSRMTIELDTEILDVAWLDEDRFLGFESKGEIGIWSVAAGVRERTLSGWSGIFRAFVLDRERGYVIAANNESVDLWDYREGLHLRQLLTVASDVRAMAMSPDGRQLAVSSRGGHVDLVPLGRPSFELAETYRLPPLSSDASALAFDGNDELLVALDSGRILRMDPSGGEVRSVLVGHLDAVDHLLVDPERDLLYSASLDTTVGVWQLSSGRLRVSLPGQVRMRRLALSPDGAVLYAGGGWSGNRINAWHTSTFRLAGRFHGHREGVTGVAIDPTGSSLLTSARDETVRVWSAAPPEQQVVLAAGRDARDLAIDASGRRFASASMDGVVTVWNAETLQPDVRLETEQWWAGCALGRDSVYVAGPVVAAFSLTDGQRLAEGPTGGGYVEKMAVDPKERWLVGGHDKRLLVWELPELSLRHSLEFPAGTGRVVHDPATDTFLLGCADSTLRWFHPSSGTVTAELRLDAEDRLVGGVALYGDLLVAGMHGGLMRWRRADDPLQTVRTSILGAAISPDGARLATAGSDHSIRLWDPATMEQLLVLRDLVYGATEVGFVAEGRRIIALSHRWDSPTYLYVWTAPQNASLRR